MRIDGSCFGVTGTVDELFYASLNHGSGAHDARFDGDDQDGAGQPVIAQVLCTLPQCQDFGMSRRIVGFYRVVVAAADNLSVDEENSPDGHLSCGLGLPSLCKRLSHPELGRCAIHGPPAAARSSTFDSAERTNYHSKFSRVKRVRAGARIWRGTADRAEEGPE